MVINDIPKKLHHVPECQVSQVKHSSFFSNTATTGHKMILINLGLSNEEDGFSLDVMDYDNLFIY